MPSKVILAVVRGPLAGQEFVFDGRTTCILGRAEDCHLQLPDDEQHRAISRHHCLLDVNPPAIRLRDFGSRNGTFLNGQRIGKREHGMSPEQGVGVPFLEHDLQDGDEIGLGNTVLRVRIVVPACCACCSVELPGSLDKGAAPFQSLSHLPVDGGHGWPRGARRQNGCPVCGRDGSTKAAGELAGDLVCAACRQGPTVIAQRLVKAARDGAADLEALRGYSLVGELGRGGMGAVYLVRIAKTGEQAALKLMLPRTQTDQRGRTLFLREAENTRALRHPNVVEVRQVGCWQGVYFMLLEYCVGGSMDALLTRAGGTLPVEEACGLALQVLKGLEYAHQAEVPVRLAEQGPAVARGLVHRDLKPRNLFLSSPDAGAAVKIGDYGLAKAFDLAGLSGQTSTGTAAGTPLFMPRQQVVNFKYARPEVDLWATAATLYHLLTGAYPRDFPPGADPWAVVLQTSAVPIRRRRMGLPKRLAEVIDLALVDQPKIGFATAAELRRAIEEAL